MNKSQRKVECQKRWWSQLADNALLIRAATTACSTARALPTSGHQLISGIMHDTYRWVYDDYNVSCKLELEKNVCINMIMHS